MPLNTLAFSTWPISARMQNRSIQKSGTTKPNAQGLCIGFRKGSSSKEYGIALGGYGFQSKAEVWPLQAADILAWHVYTDMREAVLGGLPTRAAAKKIMAFPHKIEYYDARPVTKLRDNAIQTDYYKNFVLESKHDANAKGQTAQ